MPLSMESGGSGPDGLNVVFTADLNYAMPLATAMGSVVHHTSADRDICFYVIESGFSAEMRVRVERSLSCTKGHRASIVWIAVPMERLFKLRIVHRYMSPLIYARLLLPDLLPAHVDKALYLDCDLVATESIVPLWETPMQGKALCAVRDRIGHVGAPGGLKNYRALGIDEHAPYFNSGVMLLNLKKWRRMKIGQAVLNYIEDHHDELQMGDQDGLNAVLHDDWVEMEFRWNWQIVPLVHRTGAMQCWVPSAPEQSIIHFSTFEKPWRPGCQVKEKVHFFEALDRTAWSGWRVPAWQEAWKSIKEAIHRVNDNCVKPIVSGSAGA